MSEKESEVKAAPRTEVKLKKPCVFAGKEYDKAAVKKGAKINVTASQEKWLLEQRII